MGVDIQVVQDENDIVFNITRFGSSDPACVSELGVDTGQPDFTPVWLVSSSSVCSARFVYGSVPGGFSQEAAAPVLVKGQNYAVAVSGRGFNGGAEFQLDENGRLTE